MLRTSHAFWEFLAGFWGIFHAVWGVLWAEKYDTSPGVLTAVDGKRLSCNDFRMDKIRD